jgi:spore germination cell wall hydrolase CwlJ-like protein
MTDITRTGEQDTQVQVPSALLNAITITLMVLALVGSVLLLKWAVLDKQSKFEVAQSSQITAEMRDRQLTCLARNIYYEAGSEPFEGKVAVAQVTLNRVESGKFPDDVCKTIYQKNVFYEKVVCQFSWYCDRAATIRPIHKGNYDESMVAAKKVLLEDFRLPSLKDALFYHADSVNPGWKKEKVAKIGRHIFYK